MGQLSCTGCPIGENSDNSQDRVWDIESNTCCGDDLNDDPDMGQLSCTGCPIGENSDNPGIRIWDTTDPNNKFCCGDDLNDDPDMGQAACESCPNGINQGTFRSWAAAVPACCGDDVSDCGLISSNYLCRMEDNNLNPIWFYTDNFQSGDIADMPCNGYEYLGTETTWEVCNEFWIKDVNGHDYLCAV